MTVIILNYMFSYYGVYLSLAILVFNFYINIFDQFNYSLSKINTQLFIVQSSMIYITKLYLM